MKNLEIESTEEIEVARAAIEEYRSRQVRHVGKWASRMNHPCESTTRERAFADAWAKENEERPGINSGLSALQHLLHGVNNFEAFDGEVTPKEAQDAATVIQYLGTHGGWEFLAKAVYAAGYVLIPKSKVSIANT